MKKLLLPLIILFINISPANALNIAVIETEEIIEKSAAMKKAKKKIVEQRESYQKELSEEEKDLKKKIEKLEKQKQQSKFTAETLQKKEEKLSKEFVDLNELLTRRNEALQKAEINVMSQIAEKIEEILQDIKKEDKIDIILSNKQVILYNDDMNISSKVLKRLNDELSKVKVRF
jgi:outer membrane protein